MRAAFFHGLESKPYTEKNKILESAFEYVYAPPMDYKNPETFAKVLKDIKDNDVNLLIGSSMGAYFAYCISTMTGIPTLLFNPAVVDRSFDPKVEMGKEVATQTVVFGEEDNVIDPDKSQEWLSKNGKGDFKWNWETMGHRIPDKIFSKYVKIMATANESATLKHVKLFEEFKQSFL